MSGKKWCNRDEVNSSVQVPSECFSDDDLRTGIIVSDKSTGAAYRSSASSMVYGISGGNQRWVVRIPSRRIANLEQRYTAVIDCLSQYCLPYFVYTRYISHGIRVSGKWHPVIKMEWADGVDLGTWIEHNLENKNELLRMAAQWRGMIASLNGAKIAHGNLEESNVIVTPQNGLKLIDYDNVCIPSLRGSPLVKPPNPHWNHPKLTCNKVDQVMDQFPATVGYLTLLAVAENPRLVHKHLRRDGSLLSADDYAAPRQSQILSALSRSEHDGFKKLVAKVIEWCSNRADAMGFEEAVSDCAVSLPNQHPRLRVTPLQSPEPLPKRMQQDESGQGVGDDKVPRVITRGSKALIYRWSKRTIFVTLISLLLLLSTSSYLIWPANDECINLPFDLEPVPWAPFAQFEILSDRGDKLMTRRADDPVVCLPPGDYGYQFIDENGKVFGKRSTGFTVRGQ